MLCLFTQRIPSFEKIKVDYNICDNMDRKINIVILVLCIAIVLFAGCIGPTYNGGKSTSYPEAPQKMKVTQSGQTLTIDIYSGVAVPSDYTVVIRFRNDEGESVEVKKIKFPTAAPFTTVSQIIPFPAGASKFEKPYLYIPDPDSKENLVNIQYIMEN